ALIKVDCCRKYLPSLRNVAPSHCNSAFLLIQILCFWVLIDGNCSRNNLPSLRNMAASRYKSAFGSAGK
ncbi:hypothetical protein K443DRAFT_116584, partial [Laccaria amethystina LaAM-08-1]